MRHALNMRTPVQTDSYFHLTAHGIAGCWKCEYPWRRALPPGKFIIPRPECRCFDWKPLNDAGFLEDHSEHPLEYFELSTAGKEALAKYKREWVVVKLDDIKCLLGDPVTFRGRILTTHFQCALDSLRAALETKL